MTGAGRRTGAEAGPDTGIAALIFFGLAVVYFLPTFMPGQHIYGSDYLAGGYSFHEFVTDRFSSWRLPAWVPYVYGGVPLFASPGSAFYPLRILVDLVLPLRLLLPGIFVLQFAAAGLGMYLLTREMGVRRWIALVAGLAFQFSGLAMSYVLAGHDGRIIVATLAPLFLFFLHRGIRTGRLAPFAGAAATLGSVLLSFQVQSAYYLLLGGALWAIFGLWHLGWFRDGRGLARRVGLGLGAVAFAFAMGSVNFLPFADYVDASPRGGDGRGYEYATSWSMPPAEITGVALPEHAGLLEHYHGENPFKLHTEYAGVTVVLLVILGFGVVRRDRYFWFFLGLALFALSLAFGGHTPLYRLYYALLWGTTRFRAPSISFFLVSLSLVAMAALSLEQLARLRDAADERDRLARVTWILAAAAAVAVIVLFAASASPEGPAHRPFVLGAARLAFFTLAVGAVLWAWLQHRLGALATAAILAVLTVGDLWLVDRRFLETTDPPAYLFAADDVIEFLQSQPGRFRTWVLPAGGGYHLNRNQLMLHDLDQVGGEHPNPLQRYYEYVGAGEGHYVDWGNLLRWPGFLDAANVRFLISRQQIGGLPLAYQGRNALVYANPTALPRAWLVGEAERAEPPAALERMKEPDFDPARTAVVYGDPGAIPGGPVTGAADVVEYEPDRVRLRVRSDRPALLVLADNMYPGWTARVGGEERPVVIANHTFRGVRVDAGEQEVVFRFESSSLRTGFALYVACWVILAGLGVVLLLARRRAAGAAPDPAG